MCESGNNYTQVLAQAKDKTSEIKTLNVDVDKVLAELERINRVVLDEVKSLKEKKEEYFINDYIDMAYREGISQIEEAFSSLKEYEVLIEIKDLCHYIENNLCLLKNDNAILNKVIESIVLTLKKMEVNNITITNPKEIRILKIFYQEIYRIIKIELTLSDESELLNFIKSHNQNIEYLVDLINQNLVNLENLVTDKKYMRNIYDRLDYLKAIKENRLDSRLIKEIIRLKGQKTNETSFVASLSLLQSKLQNNISYQRRLNSNKDSVESKLEKNKHYRVKRLEIGKSFITIALAAVIILTGTKRAGDRSVKTYDTTKITYSNMMEEPKTTLHTYNVLFSADEIDRTLIKAAEPWKVNDNFFERQVFEYDVSELALDNLEDYFNTDYSKYQISEKIETKKSLVKDDVYEDQLITIEKEITKLSENDKFDGFNIFMYICILVLYYQFDRILFMLCKFNLKSLVFDELNEFKKFTFRRFFKLYRGERRQLENQLEDIVTEFDQLVEENKRILDKLEESKSDPYYEFIMGKYETLKKKIDMYSRPNIKRFVK